MIDTKAYKAFKDLKTKYPAKMVLITDSGISMPGLRLAFKTHREYIEHQFKKDGIEILRHSHNYSSLDGSHPQLGLVYLANDSELQPGIEVWALIGHNAKYTEAKDEKF
jgi:hypothetical protein